MKKWFVVHSLDSYNTNPTLIGFFEKQTPDGEPIHHVPDIEKVSEIQPRDKVVYYCKKDAVIKGIYEVIQSQYDRQLGWDSRIQFEIRPIIELGPPYIKFKRLVNLLEMFKDLPKKSNWGQNIRGRNSLKLLSEHDFHIIEDLVRKMA